MGTETPKRTTLTLRMTKAELERVHAIAEHHGLNLSSVVRMLIKREERTLGLEKGVAR
jgi:hypothetical protein